MTRDEAVKTWRDMLHPVNGPRWSPEEWSKKAIDCYVALGMLNLDEPEEAAKAEHAATSKFIEIAFRHYQGQRFLDFCADMQSSGLKIVVEK